MLRIEESPALRSKVDGLTRRIQCSGQPIGLRSQRSEGRDRLVTGVVQALPEAVYVQVPAAADQAERVILDIAQALGADAVVAVDEHLREEPDEPTRALRTLEEALGGRPLIVDGWDRLKSPSMDRDIGRALSKRTRALRGWLGSAGRLFTFAMGTGPVGAESIRWRPSEPPVQLHNGAARDGARLWAQVSPDAQAFELGLMAAALGHDGDVEEMGELPPDALRSHIFEFLPGAVRRILSQLAIHGRVLPEELLQGQPGWSEAARAFGLRLGLWRRTPGGLATDDGWSRWWRAHFSRADCTRLHLDLAQRFAREARPGEPGAGRAGLALLEAHRHFLAAGEIGRARTYARYGAGLLVEAARNLSRSGRYGDAAHLYEAIVDAAERELLPVGRRLGSYARHYLHFNRARARLEPMEETERGYRRALEDWDTHALFWSRLARVLFYRGHREAAFQELQSAQRLVPEHPQKQTVLVARTVRGLLRWERRTQASERVLDAVLVWDSYQPDTALAEEVQSQLAERLEQGWQTQRIVLPGAPLLIFTQRLSVTWGRAGAGWFSEVLDTAGRGASPLEALRALVKELRAEAVTLLRGYTHQMDAEMRQRKQLLLGAIHIIESTLDASAEKSTWVFGDLERDADGRVWLTTGGHHDLHFEVPAELAPPGPLGDYPRFARVRTGASGVPLGPVLELEDAFRRSEEELWTAWEQRLVDAG